MATTYRKVLYPAAVQPLGSSSGYPKSGFFAMHFTYPDTQYDDDLTDWVYGSNPSDVWKQGLTVIVRTNIAYDSAPSEATNVIVVDLKQAATDAAAAGSSLTYDLGTQEAARLIAAKINARRYIQTTEQANVTSTGFQARYVKMSGRETYAGTADRYTANNEVTVAFDGEHPFGYPTDLPPQGTITVGGTDYSYTKVETFSETKARFTVSTTPFTPGSASSAAVSVAGESAKHTVVVSWRGRDGSDGNAQTYSAEATLGPVVQGVGSSVPLWKFIAKPMDGGNMGIPAVNKESRSGRLATNLSGHGYCRFSIEGLNSCYLPEMPPPDFTVTKPSWSGVTQAHEDNEDWTGTSTTFDMKVTQPEYGSDFRGELGIGVALDSGYAGDCPQGTAETYMMPTADTQSVKDVQVDSGFITKGILNDDVHAYPRPYHLTREVNSERVRGLTISNEHHVFDPIPVVDDQGNTLVIEGGSPFGTVIRDFVVNNVRVDEETGDEVVGPSDTFGNISPNLQIQLPAPHEIPGDIFVRSGHDRVQAWSDKSWGMGGLTMHDDQDKDFDTHDRMLVFHCGRLLHPDLDLVSTPTDITPGAVPSGTTRFFTAHRISDHVERGAVLTQTNNGVETGYPYPHHRIRFARQGHSFVTPIGHRGTPMHLRRQLHRSFGSAYSLMMEAESEHRHFGFSSPDPSNSTTSLYLDTLDVKGVAGYGEATGAFAADNLPGGELDGARLNDQTAAGLTAAYQDPEYVVAPGQVHTAVEGSPEAVSRGVVTATTISGTDTSTHLVLSSALTFNNRGDVASEFMVNGFFLDQPTLFGGRPEPASITAKAGNEDYFVRGLEEGVIVPRPATELATVPPLVHHDPEMMNLIAAPIYSAATSSWSTIATADRDLGSFDERHTNTGATPDAFLMTWLAEYGHPAFFGSVREHFMTFRYRQVGAPRSYSKRAVRSLLLENDSSAVFERLLALQWLQNYGYNGLNAGGHGNVEGLRSAGAVLMGHSTVREAQGTARLLRELNGPVRYSRAEGIGDALDPEHDGARLTVDTDSDGEAWTKFFFVMNPMVAVNAARRLPVRGWGARTTSDALDMLAGDPTENTTDQQKVLGKARFDGGVHDSVALLPDATGYGSDWMTPTAYQGVERSHPIGFVLSDHTVEATPFHSVQRVSNSPPSELERIGIGRRIGIETCGVVSPTALASGMWDIDSDDVTLNTGLDPVLDLVQYTGDEGYGQTRSKGAVAYASGDFGAAADFYAHGGSIVHTNASPIYHATSNHHYPVHGWGIATKSGASYTKAAPTPLAEVAETRQVQSRAEPRLGMVIETENERRTNAPRTYGVVSTSATSLHSDLGIGRLFPIQPSWTTNAQFTTRGFTTSAGSSAHTIADLDVKPVWSPDSNAAKGAIVASSDSVRFTPKTHAKDAWAVRGSADLPPWGGVFILRKTYLDREDSEARRVSLSGTVGHAGQPMRKQVDYIVRLVRPLKMFGYASDLMQDGWIHGAQISSTDTNDRSSQVMHRDKRYGVFEMNTDRALGEVDIIASSDGVLQIEWPDSNEHDAVYHLIPSSAMLQHFKSDAQRTVDGAVRPDIEPRYSQSTHPGGGEVIYESESNYDADGNGTAGDYMKRTFSGNTEQQDTHGRLRPYAVVRQNITNGLVLDQVPSLPSSGKVFTIGGSYWAYTSREQNILFGASTPSFSAGDQVYFSTVATPTSLEATKVFASPLPAAPTFIDNTVVVSRIERGAWWRYDADKDSVTMTSLNYRGLLPYDPTDFIMVSQRPVSVALSGENAVMRPIQRRTVQVDGRSVSSSFVPPYLFSQDGGRWRVADAEAYRGSIRLNIKNAESSPDGLAITGQHGFVGVRTSDAAMHLLNDAAGEIAGFNVTGTNALLNFDRKANTPLNAHPMLRQMAEHSPTFTSLRALGINVLDLFSTLTSLDGRQVVYEGNGMLVYSLNAFREEGKRVGIESGAAAVTVSKMFDSPNEVIIEGDDLAENEVVLAVVRDTEKMKQAAGQDAEQNLVKTLRRQIPGLKTNKEALRVAKALLSRAENGAPLVTIQGLLNATSLMPGDILNVNLPTHGLTGKFGVFEARHDYTNLKTDIVVAQYEKGIEGLISEIQARVGNASASKRRSDKDIRVDESTVSGSIRVASIMRVTVRSANHQAFVIGERGHGGIGKIGVRDGSKRARALGLSKSRPYEVR